MSTREVVISKSFTVTTKTYKDGDISLNNEIKDWIRLRWNIPIPSTVGVTISDSNGMVLFRGERLVSQSKMIESTQAIQKHLGSYEPVEIRVVHFHDDRDPDIVFNIQKKDLNDEV